MGATSGPGAVVSRVKASPRSGIGRHSPAKQNQSSPAFVNFHLVFGDLVPVNSKKCDAGIRNRPTGNRRPSERKFLIGAPLGRAGGSPIAIQKAHSFRLRAAGPQEPYRWARYPRAAPNSEQLSAI